MRNLSGNWALMTMENLWKNSGSLSKSLSGLYGSKMIHKSDFITVKW